MARLLFLLVMATLFSHSVQQEETVMDKILRANKDMNLFEGDIAQTMTSRNGIRDVSELWTTRVIPYELEFEDFSTSEQDTIQQAMDEYHARTCLRFVPRTDETDYIYINSGSGCWSWVGLQGGRQDLSLGNGCVHKGTVIHEFMHAAGFWHEHSRFDRDDWVSIQWENIQAGEEDNFYRYSEMDVSGLGVDYDYVSVMHYSATAFSSNGHPTIVASVSGAPNFGHKTGFSDKDVVKLNRLYSCNTTVGWNDWTEWSPCDARSCTKTREWFCSDPSDCSGQSVETQTCSGPCEGCQTVRISGSTWNHTQALMTNFTMTGETRSGRPVYESSARDYLFYHQSDDRWYVGPRLTNDSVQMYVDDTSIYPENITETWYLDDSPTDGFRPNSLVRVVGVICPSGGSSPAPTLSGVNATAPTLSGGNATAPGISGGNFIAPGVELSGGVIAGIVIGMLVVVGL